MEIAQRRIICIVGMHRSGTSMIARLLNICGLDLGPADRLLKADIANPLGHFEHRGFLEIDRKLLKHFHATWYGPPDLPPKWENDPSLTPLLNEACALAAGFSESRSWGWKEPRASLFLPFWRRAIPNMDFLICLRNPLEVAKSLQARNRMSVEHGAWLWYLYTLRSLRDTQQCRRLFSIFDDYFERRDEEIPRVLAFCGLDAVNRSVHLEPVVEGELRHHHSGDQLLRDEPGVPEECKKLYFGLRSLIAKTHLRSDPLECAGDVASSSAVNDFVAKFEMQPAFRYFAQSRFTSARSSQKGQRLQRFLSALCRISS
jgi:hypothetical protein